MEGKTTTAGPSSKPFILGVKRRPVISMGSLPAIHKSNLIIASELWPENHWDASDPVGVSKRPALFPLSLGGLHMGTQTGAGEGSTADL